MTASRNFVTNGAKTASFQVYGEFSEHIAGTDYSTNDHLSIPGCGKTQLSHTMSVVAQVSDSSVLVPPVFIGAVTEGRLPAIDD